MKTARFWTVAVTFAGAVIAGLVWLAPTTHGQVVVAGRDGGPNVRQIHVLGGRGSSIGVTVRDVDEPDVARYKLADRRGALVDDVDEDSPAQKAGMKSGDVVVSFDGEPVRSARQFSRIVEETPTGRTVTATVLRSGARLDLEVTPSEGSGMRMSWQGRSGEMWRGEPGVRMFNLPAMPELRELERLPELRAEITEAFGQGTLGVSVQSLNRELADYFGVKEGVLVSSVRDDSAAAKAGVKAGDVITALNGQSVDSPGDLRRLLRETEDPEVTLSVVRDRKPISLKATVEQPDRQRTKRRWPV